MPLNWSVTDCKGWEDWSERENNIKDKLIYGTLYVDLGTIELKNIDEWLFRIRMWRALYDDTFTLHYSDAHIVINREVLVKFIGLKTNSSNMTRSKWMKQLAERVEVLVERDTVVDAIDEQTGNSFCSYGVMPNTT